MRRHVAAVILPLVLMLVVPARAQTPVEDRVNTLAGTWTCRTVRGSVSRQAGRRDGNTISVTNEVSLANGQRMVLEDRYTFDERAGMWSVSEGVGTPLAVDGYAKPWAGPIWDVRGRDDTGTVQRVRFELLDNGDLRRSFARASQDGSGDWQTYSAERCRAGDEPPPADACITQNVPAQVLALSQPNARDLPVGTPHGVVKVSVELDATSRIVSAAVLESPSPNLNASALQTARASQFQTAVRDCRPVASRVQFAIVFGRPR